MDRSVNRVSRRPLIFDKSEEPMALADSVPGGWRVVHMTASYWKSRREGRARPGRKKGNLEDKPGREQRRKQIAGTEEKKRKEA